MYFVLLLLLFCCIFIYSTWFLVQSLLSVLLVTAWYVLKVLRTMLQRPICIENGCDMFVLACYYDLIYFNCISCTHFYSILVSFTSTYDFHYLSFFCNLLFFLLTLQLSFPFHRFSSSYFISFHLPFIVLISNNYPSRSHTFNDSVTHTVLVSVLPSLCYCAHVILSIYIFSILNTPHSDCFPST